MEKDKEDRVSWRIWIPKRLAEIITAKAKELRMTRNEFVARVGSHPDASKLAKESKENVPMEGVFRKPRRGKNFPRVGKAATNGEDET